MVHFFALMLWVAGGLAIAAGMPQLGVAIFVVIVVNAVFAFAQEHRADRAAALLRDLLPRRCTVRRDGRWVSVDAEQLVPTDLVKLEAGDRLSADLRLLEIHALAVDTSQLTGESVPERPSVGSVAFAGSFVVEGEARGLVEATGSRTRLAAIAGLTQAGHHPRTPLAIELTRLVRSVAFIAVGVGAAFFATALAVGTPAEDGFLFAIGVTVALVPEGLLPTVTLSLAMGAQRMAGRQALVRRLESVETLGSTTFICTDKTGTLTCNEMVVVEAWTPKGSATVQGVGYEPTGEVEVSGEALEPLRRLASAARVASNGRSVVEDGRWQASGDPMEAALDAFAHRVGRFEDEAEVRARFPFDPRRRRMSVICGSMLLVKGAPDSVLPRCVNLDEGVGEAVEAMTRRGLRVLAIASTDAPSVGQGADPDEVEMDLELLGLVGLEDPPRPHAQAAIAACRRAGIRVAMITGDHPGTAEAIGRSVGLLLDGSPVIRGDELPADAQLLAALVDRDGAVLCRISPEDKLRIAQALRSRGHVVAMTGDGVNDGPALQAADIGIAMGRTGSDVAREAADLVLLDDDFATIVAAIEQGRSTFANIRRFLTYHLTDNVAELTPFVIWAISGGRFPLALGVLQILALDIGTDLLPALALGAEPPPPHVLDRPPTSGGLLDRTVLTRAFGVLGPTEALVGVAAFLTSFMASGWSPGESFPTGRVLAVASGAAFSAVVLGQLANAWACRSSTRPPWRLGWGTNHLLVGAVVAELAMLGVFLFVTPVAELLDQRPPSMAGATVALCSAPLVLAADAAYKSLRSRRLR